MRKRKKTLGRPRLTARQAEMLVLIKSFLGDNGYPPTIREIGERMTIRSTNGVLDHLKALERKGLITREAGKPRSIMPVRLDRPRAEVPLVGRIAAGRPLFAHENVDSHITLDSSLLGRDPDLFALRVEGHSMIEDGIFDGDLIFVKKQSTANPGAIVVALIDGEATVKRYHPESDQVRLQPANNAMEPIIVRREEFRATSIQGVVVGVFRKL